MKDKQPWKRSRKMTDAASVVDSTLRYLRIDKKADSYNAFQFWNEVVGEEIAAVAQPVKITRGNILSVRVLDATWAQELTLQKHEIVKKLRAVAAETTIEDIRFIPGDPKEFKKVAST